MKTVDVSAFDGAVTFHMRPYKTLRFEIALGDLPGLFPEFVEKRDNAIVFKPGRGGNELAAFLYCIGFTKDISFKLSKDSLPMLSEFRQWWQKHGRSFDFRQMFEAYTEIADSDLSETWYSAYASTHTENSPQSDASEVPLADAG